MAGSSKFGSVARFDNDIHINDITGGNLNTNRNIISQGELTIHGANQTTGTTNDGLILKAGNSAGNSGKI